MTGFQSETMHRRGDEEYNRYLQNRSFTGQLYRLGFLFPWLERRLHGKTLDVGCGLGQFVAWRNKKQKNSEATIGLDINKANVAWCRSHGIPAEAIDGDRWPLADHCFDSAVANHVLEHLIDPAPLLSELKRVVKPEGIIIIGVPGIKGYNHDPDHKRFYDRADLEKILLQFGFVPQKTSLLPLPLPWLGPRLKQFSVYCVARSANASSPSQN